MLAVLFSPLAFGYRHILPVLPFVIILAGNAANSNLEFPNFQFQIKLLRQLLKFKVWHLLFGLLILWCAVSAILIFPYHLSYFNELQAGQPTRTNS